MDWRQKYISYTLCKKCRQWAEAKAGIFDTLCEKCLKEKEEVKRKENPTLYGKE